MKQALEIVPETSPLNPADILTPDELCERLKVKPSWVKEQLRSRTKIRNKGKRTLPCLKISKHVVRFYWPDVAAWMLEQNKD
jgi:hypothetical protein